MPFDKDEMIQILKQTNKEQERTIEDLRNTIRELRITVANLNETLDEFMCDILFQIGWLANSTHIKSEYFIFLIISYVFII